MNNKLQHKLFWNWDHSTNWKLNVNGIQNTGVGNYYTKAPDVFETDFKRMVDFASANGIDGVGVVGLLRESHGGEFAARRLCTYAREKGVRIYLIAGLYSYGGLFYEGNHPLSLENFLAKNPECIGRNIGGDKTIVPRTDKHNKIEYCGCPSSKTLNNYILDCLDLLFRMVPDLGGIQMEVGDSWLGLCHCDKCRERREAMNADKYRSPAFYFSDMAGIYPQAGEVVRNAKPDAWVICEMYGHFRNNKTYFDAENPAIKELLKMPESTFLQWGDRRVNYEAWAKEPLLPEHLRKFQHIYRCHHSTQWSGGRHTLAVEEVRRQCEMAFRSGMQNVSMFGECSPFSSTSEFNYLALNYFGDNPLNSTDDFARDVMAPRLGGNCDAARKFLQFGVLTKEPEKISAAVQEIMQITAGIKNSEALRRWINLANFLNSYYWEFEHTKRAANAQKLDLDMV